LTGATIWFGELCYAQLIQEWNDPRNAR
jgi:hypothetical protein